MKKVTLLAVLQQSEYDFVYFQRWLDRHQNDHELLIKPDHWTMKLVLINLISTLLFFLPVVVSIKLATFFVGVPENLFRHLIYYSAQWKLQFYQKRGLQVLIVAGSFAKTSTKHLLFNLLKDNLSVIATPESVNTKLGIARVIHRQLQAKNQLFIVELGEYQPGDMTTLLDFVRPQWGILTPLAQQHLERMGSFENIVKTFQEVTDFFAKQPKALLVHQANQKYFQHLYPWLSYYPATNLKISQVAVNRQGTSFSLKAYDFQGEKLFTKLYGEHQLENALPAFFLAQQLGLPLSEIAKQFANLPFINRRHQPFFGQNDVLVLDNSYNTNPEAIQTSLKLLAQLSKAQKIVITMGFVELGSQELTENRQLGELLAKKVDLLGVVDSTAAAAIKAGFLKTRQKRDLFTGVDAKSIIKEMQMFIKPGATILIEGGSRELYQ